MDRKKRCRAVLAGLPLILAGALLCGSLLPGNFSSVKAASGGRKGIPAKAAVSGGKKDLSAKKAVSGGKKDTPAKKAASGGRKDATAKAAVSNGKKNSPAKKAAPKVKKLSWAEAGEKVYIPVRSSKKLEVKIAPKKAKESILSWSTSDKKIAEVSKNGKVSGKKKGTATITCRVAAQPKKKIRCRIKVVKPSKKIRVDKSTVVLQIGNSTKRQGSIAPESATVKGIRYASSNPKVVTVSKNGKLTGKSEGTAKISLVPEDGFAKEVSYPVRVIGKLKNSARFIAHRGLSSRAPENTIKAFQLAGEAKFWGAETDVRKTKDGYFILMHDDTLKRMCGIDRAPGDMTLEEIKACPVTGGNHREDYQDDPDAVTIPTLEEYLHTCLQYRMVPVVEVKMSYQWDDLDEQAFSAEDTQTEKAISELSTVTVDAYDMELQSAAEDDLTRLYDVTQSIMGKAKVVFIAFDLKTLIKLGEIAGERGAGNIELQHLVSRPDPGLISLYKEKRINIDSDLRSMNVATAKTFMKSGIAVNIWTVDDPARAWEYAKNKISYITTNRKFW